MRAGAIPSTQFPFDISELTQEFVNRYFDAKTQAERDVITLECLLYLLGTDQLAQPERFVSYQKPLLDYILKLPIGLGDKNERLTALKAMLDTSKQLNKFYLITSARKPNSLKREHGFLFAALCAYVNLATEEDSQLNFTLAYELNELIKNKDKRSEKVLAVLLTLLSKSIYKGCNNLCFDGIYEILRPQKPDGSKPEINLRRLIANTNSSNLLRQYAGLLLKLFEYGMHENNLMTFIEKPMQNQYKHNPTIFDLAANLADPLAQHAIFSPIAILLSRCAQKKPNSGERIAKIFTQPLLSIGKVYSAYTTETAINRIYNSIVTQQNADAFYFLWINGFLDLLPKSKLPLPVAFQNLIIDTLSSPRSEDDRMLALTLASTSDFFPSVSEKIQSALAALAQQEPSPRQHKKVAPALVSSSTTLAPAPAASAPTFDSPPYFYQAPQPLQPSSDLPPFYVSAENNPSYFYQAPQPPQPSSDLPPFYVSAENNPFIPAGQYLTQGYVTQEDAAAYFSTSPNVQFIPGVGFLIPPSDASTTSRLMTALRPLPFVATQQTHAPSAPDQTTRPPIANPAYFDQQPVHPSWLTPDQVHPENPPAYNPNNGGQKY
jgi:hypothetical protein